MALDELFKLMDKFVRGEEISVQAANSLESAILDCLPEHPDLEDLADELAQYSPTGGDFLFDYAQMRPRVAHCLEVLRARVEKK
jgi:hypothetical protein